MKPYITLIALGFIVVAQLRADVLDFEGTWSSPTYTEDGHDFTLTNSLVISGFDHSSSHSWRINQSISGVIRPQDIIFDVTNVWMRRQSSSGSVTVSGYDQYNTLVQSESYTVTTTYQSFSLSGFEGLARVNFSNPAPADYLYIDDITYTYDIKVQFECGDDYTLDFKQTNASPPESAWPLGQFSLSAGETGATLNSVQVSIGGTSSGIGQFRLYRATTNDYSTAIASSDWESKSGSIVTFSPLFISIPDGIDYYWIAVTLTASASGTIDGLIPNSSYLTFTNGVLSSLSSYGYLNDGADASLPVELSSFSGCCTENGVLLEWVTESELENAGFILERQKLGEMSWVTIASYETYDELKGQGNSSSRTEYEFTDVNVCVGKRYFYRLSDVDFSGNVNENDVIEITVTELVVPHVTVLEPAYPNPFNPETRIQYKLAEDAVVSLLVVDLMGRTVRTIEFGRHQRAGNYIMYWNGREESGALSPSGMYLLVLHAGDVIMTQKVMLMK